MINKQLELIRIIAGGYGRHTLSAIQAFISTMDMPINVRNCRMMAAEANEAYLDLMRRTAPSFRRMSVIESFSPDDRVSGQAGLWVAEAPKVIKSGYGAFPLRMWNGKDVLPLALEAISINGWVVTALLPRATLQVVPFAPHQALPLSPHKLRRAALSVVP